MLLTAGIPVYVWVKWRESRRPTIEPELELPVLDHEPDRIFQLPAGIK